MFRRGSSAGWAEGFSARVLEDGPDNFFCIKKIQDRALLLFSRSVVSYSFATPKAAQARILEWVAISFSRSSSRSRG